MSRKKSPRLVEAAPLALQDLASLEGEVRLVKTESGDGNTIFYPVKIEKVSLLGCSIKATVHPIDGIGRFALCCSELYDSASAMKELENEATTALRDEEWKRLYSRPRYHKERAANFALFVEEHCSIEEQETLKEENKGITLTRASDDFIRKHLWYFLNRKHDLLEEDGNVPYNYNR